MKIPLITSIVILVVFGLRSAIGLPAAFRLYDYGELSEAARLGSIAGAFTSVFLLLGLAYGQWRTRGRFGLFIGIFAGIVFVAQSFLMYLAVSSGRVPLSGAVLIKFSVFTVIGVLGLAVSSLIAYAQRPRS